MPKQPTAVITRTRKGEFRFTLLAPNSRKLDPRDTYKRKATLTKMLQKYFPGFVIMYEKGKKK